MSAPGFSSQMASVYTDFQGLEGLKAAAKRQTPAAREQAARQFEALFIQMMLKAMRDATPQNDLFGSTQQRLYRSLFDHQVSLNLAQGRGIGLRAMIERGMGNQHAGTSRAAPQVGPTAAPADLSRPAPADAGHAVTERKVPAKMEDFVSSVLPYARAAATQLGVAPAVLVAQAALETGWGRHVPAGADGASSNNFFGIKAERGWSGGHVSVPTLEYQDGLAVRKRSAFRAYPSIAASFADYARLVSGHPRYRAALAHATDPAGYLRGLQQGGYATDPEYAAKVNSILERKDFREAVDNGMNGRNRPAFRSAAVGY